LRFHAFVGALSLDLGVEGARIIGLRLLGCTGCR
jgi:hypothetical protein